MSLDKETLELYHAMKEKAVELMRAMDMRYLHLYIISRQTSKYNKGDSFSLGQKGQLIYWKNGKREIGKKLTIESLIQAYEDYGIIMNEEEAVKTFLEVVDKKIKKTIN